MENYDWKDKISHHAQFGGIETAVMDNGTGRGTRIAWINTGTGLRYKVVIDRAMDIADAFYNHHGLAWINHTGITPPEPFSNQGLGWLRTFGGGLLITCGLDHVGGPESDAYGSRGQHGQISNIPAEIISVIQPDPVVGQMQMSITGKIKQTQPFGPCFELTRTISGTLGKPSIFIHDEVVNRGNMAIPHMILYHFNFGWPLADEGAGIIWKGEWVSRDKISDRIFNQEHDFRKCPPVLKDHAGPGEAAAFIDILADDAGMCACGIHNERLGLAVVLHFSKKQLPWLTNWQHWGRGEYVTGLEPGTHQVIGQARARKEGTLIEMEPGEKRIYDLEVEVLSQPEGIAKFLKESKTI